MTSLQFDIAHLLSGGMLVLSLLLLYQDRILATLNVFAAQAIVLSFAVAWQAYVQDALHLVVTAAIALVVKGFIIPAALNRIVHRLGIHREIEQVIGAGPTHQSQFRLSGTGSLPAGRSIPCGQMGRLLQT